MNHLKPGLMDDENTALWLLSRIKNPVFLVMMCPGTGDPAIASGHND
ncbi:hypothetical protein [Microcoleus vaginatus]